MRAFRNRITSSLRQLAQGAAVASRPAAARAISTAAKAVKAPVPQGARNIAVNAGAAAEALPTSSKYHFCIQ